MNRSKKISYECLKTIDLLSWRFKIFRKEVEEVKMLSPYEKACEQMEKRIKSSKLYDGREILKYLN